MKNVKTYSGQDLSPIGIGTYGIGGKGHRDVDLRDIHYDQTYVKALITQFDYGYNFSEISLGYGHGKAAEIFTKAIKNSNIKRENLFLTNSLYPRDLTDFSILEKDIDQMYEIFDTEYFDSTLVTQSLVVKFGYEKVIGKLWNLLKTGKTRFVSLSNSNKQLIKNFDDEFGDKLYAHETHISFEIRECQDEGIFDLCDELDVQSIIWRPLRQGRTITHNWEPLVRLSEQYHKTQNQIILNWMMHLDFKPEVFSTSSTHIKENWEAMNFKMDVKDYDEITNYRVPGYVPPKINWDNMGNGDSIVPLVMGFEENITK